MKKRKTTQADKGVRARVDKLERKVSRYTPDLQYLVSNDAVPSTLTVGYHEYWLNLTSTAMLSAVSGDFIFEGTQFRVHPRAPANVLNWRVDVVVFKADDTFSLPHYPEVDAFESPKYLKSYASVAGNGNINDPMLVTEGQAKTGLVVKKPINNTTTTFRNGHYLVLRYWQLNTTDPQFKISTMSSFREK